MALLCRAAVSAKADQPMWVFASSSKYQMRCLVDNETIKALALKRWLYQVVQQPAQPLKTQA